MRRRSIAFGVMIVIGALGRPGSAAAASPLIEGQSWQLVARGYGYAEGPIADSQGRIYFCDMRGSKILRLDSAGMPEVFVDDSGQASGLAFGPDGRLYACQQSGDGLVAYDKQGRPSVIAGGIKCNDLVVRSDGTVYATVPDHSAVYRVRADGTVTMVAEGIECANGVIFWPDEAGLAVTDTCGPTVWGFRIGKDGDLSEKQAAATLQLAARKKGSGADGMATDDAGRLYVATHLGVQIFDRHGAPLLTIPRPQKRYLSNLSFGGPEFDTLYATSKDKLYRIKLRVSAATP
jgi:sugar lactone lactonase YvrE